MPERGGGLRIPIPETERLDPALPTSQFRPGRSLPERPFPPSPSKASASSKTQGHASPPPCSLPRRLLLPPTPLTSGSPRGQRRSRPAARPPGLTRSPRQSRAARPRAQRGPGEPALRPGLLAPMAALLLPRGPPPGRRCPEGSRAGRALPSRAGLPAQPPRSTSGASGAEAAVGEPERKIGAHASDPPEQVVPAGGGRALRSPCPFLLSERASSPRPGAPPGLYPGARPLVPLAPAIPGGGQRGPASRAGGRRAAGGGRAGPGDLQTERGSSSPGAGSAPPRPAPPRGGPASPRGSRRPGLDPH